MGRCGEQADRLARKKRRQEQDMDVSDEEEEVDDDEDMDDDGDLDDGDTLPEAKKGLAEAQRRHEAAQVPTILTHDCHCGAAMALPVVLISPAGVELQVEVQRLEQLAALKAKRAAAGADMVSAWHDSENTWQLFHLRSHVKNTSESSHTLGGMAMLAWQEEDLVASLVPESYRDLSDTGDEHAVKDLQVTHLHHTDTPRPDDDGSAVHPHRRPCRLVLRVAAIPGHRGS